MNTTDIENMLLHDMMERGFPIFARSIFTACLFEMDVMGINKNGYIYEYEIKQSRSDFKADFKKTHKHIRLENRDSFNTFDEWHNGKRTGNTLKAIAIPNRFFYVCNNGMIKNDEVPEYAGLIYVLEDGGFEIVKNAKLLHKEKAGEMEYKAILSTLSERQLLGCSKMKYISDKMKSKNDKILNRV